MAVNKPTFNIFGPATKCDIRVGYISTDRGYIDDLSVYEANKHAKLDPGSTFIFRTRDEIRYLNINEVNALTPDDLDPVESGGSCKGVHLDSVPDEPYIEFYGGGGLGAQANPVIGDDGALLSVDMVRGGFGYKLPPQAELRDDLNIGAGAILRPKLCEAVETFEVRYDKEEDFEEYDLTSCEPIDIKDYGVLWGVDAQIIGKWDPKTYANLSTDPIRREIQEYQRFLSQERAPWWTTRREVPLSVTSEQGTKRVVHPVRHWYWGGSRTGGVTVGGDPLDFVDAAFEVYTQGGHGRGLLFQFTSADGSHKFKIKADNYKDGKSPEEVIIRLKPNMVYNVTSAGSHKKGRGTEQGLITPSSFGGPGKEQDDAGGGPESSSIFADLVGTKDDDDDLQVRAKMGVFKQGAKGKSSDGKHDTFALTYILNDGNAFTPTTTTPVVIEVHDSFMNNHAISPVPPSDVPGSDFAGIWYTFVWEEDFPYDGEYVFRGMRDNEARMYIDNVYIPNATDPTNSSSLTNFDAGSGVMGSGGTPAKIKKVMTAGVHQIRIELLNIPIKEKKIIQPTGSNDVTFKITTSAWFSNGISIPGLGINVQKGYKGSQLNETFTKTPVPGRLYEVICVSPETKHGIKLRTQGESTLQMEEDDDMDWQDLVCNASQGRFIDIIGNTCKFILDKPPEPPPVVASQGSTDSQEFQISEVFSTTSHIDKADRQLWRTNVYGRGGFLNAYGVCPFDTLHPLPDNPYAGTHRIIWYNINFPIDGNYNIQVAVDDNVNLTFKKRGVTEVVIRKEGFVNKLDTGWPDNNKPGNHSTGTDTYIENFTAGNYDIIADLEQIPGGAFGFGGGGTADTGGNVEARFIKEGNVIYLAVTGSGSATLRFNMRADDKWNTAGVAASEIRIDSDQGQIKLKRKSGVSKETVVESGPFTAGRNYKVNIIGAVSGAGTSRVYDKRVELLDAHGDDTNVELKLDAITNKIPDPVKGINPMALAIKINTEYGLEEFVSPKTWNENPMGVALTIDAPMPPIPQEPIIDQEGRCPNNPTWTTRFPGAREQWWPVKFYGSTSPVGKKEPWAPFFNRYAISPIPPLSTRGSDGGGVVYSNEWDVQITHEGWYKLSCQRDDTARIYIDGKLVFDVLTSGDMEWVNHRDKVKSVKFFLSIGTYKIRVEVENNKTDTYELVDEVIFNTADWAVPVTTVVEEGNADVTFRTTSSAKFANWIEVEGLFRVSKEYNGAQIDSIQTHSVEIGKEYSVEVGSSAESQRGPGIFLRTKGKNVLQMEEWKDEDYTDIISSASRGKWIGPGNGAMHPPIKSTKCKFVVEPNISYTGGLDSGTVRDGVIYEGPRLATYHVHALGPSLTPWWTTDDDFRANVMGREWTSVWRNVKFPETGRYKLEALADDKVTVFIDGQEVGHAKVYEHIRTWEFNASRGKHDIMMIYHNIPGGPTNTFWNNPVHISVIISRKVDRATGISKSWTENPIGVAAALIPPPCPREVGGKGVVCEVEIDDPGNNYPIPPTTSGIGTYPVRIDITDIKIKDPGINYDCSKDIIVIEPSGGAVAVPNCDPMGRMLPPTMISTGKGLRRWPSISIVRSPEYPGSSTGIGAEFIPVLTVTRDPVEEDQDPDQLIQVTDLVGLKQTGYYDGRPYYGAVFYKDGIRYAGYYETAGQLVQIYDTLQESIDARITTPPSAIQRSGTDITSNNPRLDIPGTPDNLI